MKYYNEEELKTPLPQCTLYEYIKQNNKGYENRIALMYFGTEISYSKMFQQIDLAAKAFHAIGVKAGDIVSFISITTPELVYALYAVNKIGAVCNMIDP